MRLRVRRAVAGEVVDHVAAVGQPTARIEVGRARLGVLPGDPAELDHRHRRAVGQHDRHLQQHPHLAGDVGLRGGLERLGAVAALQQERLAPGDGREPLAQLVDLGGDHQRRHRRQGRRDRLQCVRVGPGRLLGRRQIAPGVEVQVGRGHPSRLRRAGTPPGAGRVTMRG